MAYKKAEGKSREEHGIILTAAKMYPEFKSMLLRQG